jgi:hypothetical protein
MRRGHRDRSPRSHEHRGIVIQAIAVNKPAPTSFCVRTASDCRNVTGHDFEAGELENNAHRARSIRSGR